MEIHELPTGTVQSTDYIALDNGSATRKVNYGGQISTLNSKTTVNTGTFSKVSTVTLNAATKLHKTGDTVVFAVDASTSATIGTGSGGAGFVELPSGYRPASAVLVIGMDSNNTVHGFYIPANGKIQVLIANIQSGATFRFSGSFSLS